MEHTRVLGTRLDLIGRSETLNLVRRWLSEPGRHGLYYIVTAYSEFYVAALKDRDFRMALEGADLVVPDGVGPLSAVSFQRSVISRDLLPVKIFKGLKTGIDILGNRIGETVPGVWLFDELTRMAAMNGWKVFLLGGWDNVSQRTATMLLKRFPKLEMAYDEGEKKVGTDEKRDAEVVKKINKFAPDILFVAYNPVKQEKWLASHKNVLKAKIGIGVGGTFNEYLGEFKKAPMWMEKMGLKWLWRLIQEPKRFKRIWNAIVVFPWKVYRY